MTAQTITIIGASAGSGKTHRLTGEVTSSIGPNAARRIPLESLVAVTFTRKAHAELESRIRHKLVADGAYEEAMRLPLAYIGTVHAVCLRLLQEFALDAGLSPKVDVTGDDPSRLLRKALESALAPDLRDRLDALAHRTELHLDQQQRRVDWHTPVYEIMELARSNRIAPEALPAMARRSADGLLRLLPTGNVDPDRMDRELRSALDEALAAVVRADDRTNSVAKLISDLENVSAEAELGPLPWGRWAKLAKLRAPKKVYEPMLVRLNEAASRYESHPRLHDDVRNLTYALYEAARVGLDAYAEWKRTRHVIDYVDMLDGALDLLDNERVRRELTERLRLVVVDEFQDTSPIQLAVFVSLHRLAARSVWVGDRKQCIFEYAGADPALMDRVADWVAAEGGTRDQLEQNHRSRPELVDLCSEIFGTALTRYGFRRDDVVVRAAREAESLGDAPPLGLWCLRSTKQDNDAACLAEGVRRLVADSELQVVDRETRRKRNARPGDIAVLVATSREASELADALHARGVRAALARSGLLGTPEGRLIDAALRWLHDASDTLAAATVDALCAFDGASPDAWLDARIRDATTERDDAPSSAGWRKGLEDVRTRLSDLSPAEAVDLVADAVNAVDLCVRWPSGPQRLANLDALRALAVSYEDRCEREREAATIAGLLRFFDDLREERLHAGEMIAFDAQHVPTDDGAVVVSTYHKSKGLEWPIVVLASLHRKERRDAFSVAPEADGHAFDPERPLSGRWIRCWPWPFGRTEKAPLAEAAEQSTEGRAVALREDQERARLLYVGFTRARDQLVLAVRTKPLKNEVKPDKAWLDGLRDANGTPVLTLPTDAADNARAETLVGRAGGPPLSIPTRVFQLDVGEAATERAKRSDVPWFASRKAAAGPRPPYRLRPSDDVLSWPEIEAIAAKARIGHVHRLPSAIALDATRYATDALGNAVHAFFAADAPGLAMQERLERARRLLVSAGVSGVVRAESVVRASEELRAWVTRSWPTAKLHAEVPVGACVGTGDGRQMAEGIIDLLVETSEGFVIVDHKTFPAKNESAIVERTLSYAEQLAAYRWIVKAASMKPVFATLVHYPVSGVIAECIL